MSPYRLASTIEEKKGLKEDLERRRDEKVRLVKRLENDLKQLDPKKEADQAKKFVKEMEIKQENMTILALNANILALNSEIGGLDRNKIDHEKAAIDLAARKLQQEIDDLEPKIKALRHEQMVRAAVQNENDKEYQKLFDFYTKNN